MADPLLGEQGLTVERDGATGDWFVQGWRPGPAGSASVELAGGIELDLDVAETGAVAALVVPSDAGPRARAVLGDLLGERRTAEVLRMQPGSKVVRLSEQSGSRSDGAGTDRRLVRLALARLSGRDAEHPVVQAVARLEAAVAAARLGSGLGLSRPARDDARRGLALLLDAAPLDDVSTQGIDGVEALLRSARRLLPPGDALREASRPLRDGGLRPPDLTVSAAAMAPAPPPTRTMSPTMDMDDFAPAAPMMATVHDLLPVPPLVDPLPLGIDRDDVTLRRSSHAEVVVEVLDADSSGLWARAISHGVLVALVPFRPGIDVHAARLLVPPGAVDLHVELVADAALPVRTDARRAAEVALRIGRTAARADRLGKRSHDQARQRWRRTAEAWADAGDGVRAGLARERAGSDRRRVPAPALDVDALAEVLEPPA